VAGDVRKKKKKFTEEQDNKQSMECSLPLWGLWGVRRSYSWGDGKGRSRIVKQTNPTRARGFERGLSTNVRHNERAKERREKAG